MKSNDIIKKITDNWPTKVICILVSVLLYMFGQISTLDKRSFSIPLKVKVEGGLSFSDKVPKNIRVTVRGDSNEIGLLQEKDFLAYIDTSEYTSEGMVRIPVQLDLSSNVTTVEHLEITTSPESIPLHLERKISSLVKITENIYGSCLDGYEITNVSIVPEMLQITGTSNQINSTKFLETNVINVDQKSGSFSVETKVTNPNSMIALTDGNVVTVNIEIKPIQLNKTFESSVIFYDGLSEKFQIENMNNAYKISLSGSKNILEPFVLTPLTVQVDCSQINEVGHYELPLIVTLPNDIVLESIEPKSISIDVIDFVVLQEQPEIQEDLPIDTEQLPQENVDNQEESQTNSQPKEVEKE